MMSLDSLECSEVVSEVGDATFASAVADELDEVTEMVPIRREVDLADLPRWYPRWRGKPAYHGNKEALAWALDSIGRSVSYIGAGAFLSTALLQLAKEAAGCDTSLTTVCENRVYGIRPSSLLTTYTIVVGVASATLMPLMGAIVDYTPHRRLLGRIMSVVFILLLFPQIFIGPATWFAVAILQVGVAFIGWALTMLTYAYLPELTDSEEKLTTYTESFSVISFTSMVLYLGSIVGIAALLGLDDDNIRTARLGQAVSFVFAAVLLPVAWFRLFEPRPSMRQLPPHRSLWTAGFVQVYHTSLRLVRELKGLKWFFISVSLADAAIHSLATIAITYLTDTLEFTAQENGIAVLLMLVGSIPGGIAGGFTIKKVNPIRSSILGTFILMINTVAAAVVLTGPGQQMQTYLLAVVWGIGTGWKWTTDRLLASTIIPPGQDAELMGYYLFAGQVLTWLPPLIFTVMNEAEVDQRVGIGTLSVYFCLSIAALFMMGNYRDVVTFDERASTPRRKESVTTAVTAEAVGEDGNASDEDFDESAPESPHDGV